MSYVILYLNGLLGTGISGRERIGGRFMQEKEYLLKQEQFHTTQSEQQAKK